MVGVRSRSRRVGHPGRAHEGRRVAHGLPVEAGRRRHREPARARSSDRLPSRRAQSQFRRRNRCSSMPAKQTYIGSRDLLLIISSARGVLACTTTAARTELPVARTPGVVRHQALNTQCLMRCFLENGARAWSSTTRNAAPSIPGPAPSVNSRPERCRRASCSDRPVRDTGSRCGKRRC